MRSQTNDIMMSLKSFCQDAVEQEHQFGDFSFKDQVGAFKKGFVIENIKILGYSLPGEVLAGKTNNPVKNREGIPHGAICFLCDNMQGIIFGLNTLLLRDIFQVFLRIFNRDPLEVKYLATG